jgi:hypothetical protein
MKLLLVVVLLVVVFGGGGWRARRLIKTIRQLPKDYADGRDRAADPIGHAKDVTPPDTTSRDDRS